MRSVLFLIVLMTVCGSWTTSAYGQDDPMSAINPDMPARLKINEERVKASGIRRLEGKHIVLYTDLRERSDLEELVTAFDMATDQWCEHFEIDKARAEPWKVSVMLIGKLFQMRSAGLVPRNLPKFEAGVNQGHEIWLYPQQGNYYTRHLLLHEGTHAFMQWFLGDSGPPWYSEGMAEMLALHEWKDGQLKLNFQVTSNEQAEYWGRPKKIRELRDEGNIKTLQEIMAVEAIFAKQVENYAWSWAACEFFKRHPLTVKPFKELSLACNDTSPRFSSRFLTRLEPVRPQIERDWKLFVHELDYGIQSDTIAITNIEPSDKDIYTVQTDRSWQRTAIKVQKGDKLVVSTQGKYQVNQTSQPWICEANGVTIDYYKGRPLGMLMMGISNEDSVEGLLKPVGIGNRKKLVAEFDGELCFRINESTIRMADNKGEIKVHIKTLNQ